MRDIERETSFREWVEKIVNGDIPVKNREVVDFDIVGVGTDKESWYLEATCEAVDGDGVVWVVTYTLSNNELTDINVKTLSNKNKYS